MKKNPISIRSSVAEYLTDVVFVGDQKDSIEMHYEDENIWLTQKMMATLYDVDVRTINEHIKKIYSDSELEEDATIRNFRIVQTEGSRQVTRDTKHYNLQMIIAVGFKLNTERVVQFRKWANSIVKDYTIKGWAMDGERSGNAFIRAYRICLSGFSGGPCRTSHFNDYGRLGETSGSVPDGRRQKGASGCRQDHSRDCQGKS